MKTKNSIVLSILKKLKFSDLRAKQYVEAEVTIESLQKQLEFLATELDSLKFAEGKGHCVDQKEFSDLCRKLAGDVEDLAKDSSHLFNI